MRTRVTDIQKAAGGGGGGLKLLVRVAGPKARTRLLPPPIPYGSAEIVKSGPLVPSRGAWRKTAGELLL